MSILIPTMPRTAPGWPKYPAAPEATYVRLEELLVQEYPDDRHFAAYSVPGSPRLAGDAPANLTGGVPMVLAVFDLDAPDHRRTPEWDAAAAAGIAAAMARWPGGAAYETRGGMRLVWALAEPFYITGPAGEQAWREWYRARCAELEAVGVPKVDRLSDWTRLFRLPRVVRDGERQRCRVAGKVEPPGICGPRGVPKEERSTHSNTGETVPPDPPNASDEVVARARAALTARAPAIEGQGGDQLTFATAAWLLHDCGLDKASAWALLCEWNQRCQPPWSETELREKFYNADTYAGHDPGSQRHAWDLEDAVAAAVARMSAPPVAIDGLYGTDIGEFDAGVDEDPPYLVGGGLLPAEVPSVIAGHPGTRKSWLMYLLALVVARGRTWDQRPVQRGRVLVIGREDGARETRRRLRRLARGLGFELGDLAGWLRVEVDHPFRLDVPEHVAVVADTARRWGAAAVFVDNLSRVHGQSEKDASEMAPVMNAWADLCASTGAAVVLLHHVTKDGDGNWLQRLRGSSHIAAVARHVIGLDKVGDDRVKVSTDGNMQGSEIFQLRYEDRDLEGGPAVVVHPVGAAELAAELGAELEREILEVLADGPASGGAVARGVGKNKARVLTVLKRLQDQRRLIRDGQGRWILKELG